MVLTSVGDIFEINLGKKKLLYIPVTILHKYLPTCPRPLRGYRIGYLISSDPPREDLGLPYH